MIRRKKSVSLLTAAVLAVSAVAIDTGNTDGLHAAAASYPMQEFRMAIANTDRNINISAAETGAPVTSDLLNGTDSEEWRLNYIQAGVYEIVNVQTGYVLTADGADWIKVYEEQIFQILGTVRFQ